MAFKIVIAGGGTGGHLFPGIALAEQFKEKWQAEVIFIGTSYGIEQKILPKMSYKFKKICIRGLQRKFDLKNLLLPIRLIVSLLQCAMIYISERPQVVIGTGGYVSAPALLTAILFRIPTVIQEQNSYPGAVNRFVGKYVAQVHLTFEDSRVYFTKQKNLFVSGNPVRAGLAKVERADALKKFHLADSKSTLFVFGGSQGARGINNALRQALPEIKRIGGLQILWATGAADWPEISKQIQGYQNIKAQPFIEDMAAAYSAADFILCRAGATTLSEIALTGRPAILVPFPYSAADHQVSNARSVEKAGGAQVILEQNLNTEKLLAVIKEFIEKPQKRSDMAKALSQIARPNAARDIAERAFSLIRTV